MLVRLESANLLGGDLRGCPFYEAHRQDVYEIRYRSCFLLKNWHSRSAGGFCLWICRLFYVCRPLLFGQRFRWFRHAEMPFWAVFFSGL